MTTPTVPQVPPLANIPGVELIRTGQWDISTGTWTVTTEDIAAAIAALDCPAVRRPVLKLGHVDPRFDGEPAVGWIDNLTATDDGHTLLGDYVGMPGWLAAVLPSAYPDRSIEGQYDFRCQIGHTHPFVLTAVALLGVSTPGIGALTSLQDVASLYGVAAVSPLRGVPIAVTVRARKGDPMPNPTPVRVAAGVTTEDVRRKYYANAPWSVWITEMQLDPLQLIISDDSTGQLARVPVEIGSGDGEDAVSFGAPVPVVVRYEDVPATADIAASGSDRVFRFASRAESRPGTQTPGRQASGDSSIQERTAVDFTDTQLTKMRQALGLADDADREAITNAVLERVSAPAASALPEGTVVIDSDQLVALQAAAARGEQARARQEREDREAAVQAAIADGRIPPARREHWLTQLEIDPGSKDVLASLAPGLIPVGEPIGHSVNSDNDRLYAAVFGEGA
jgi:hypothetical protein